MSLIENYPCPYQFIVIEGNIGAGKTSLASRISEEYQAKLILERFADNPFLPKFYKDPDRYAFPVEMSFLADRYNQLKKDLQSRELFYSFTVADYYFMKSLIFAKNTLAPDEYSLYAQLFQIIYQSLPRPDLYVYLHRDPESLLSNIRNRGREYEAEISANYLKNIQKGYFEFFKQQPEIPIVVVDVNGSDFVKEKGDFIALIKLLFTKRYSPGIKFVSCRDLNEV